MFQLIFKFSRFDDDNLVEILKVVISFTVLCSNSKVSSIYTFCFVINCIAPGLNFYYYINKSVPVKFSYSINRTSKVVKYLHLNLQILIYINYDFFAPELIELISVKLIKIF